jgi:putative phosphoesterase
MEEVSSMMVGVISDTHISKDAAFFEAFIKRNFSELDMILHLGDYTSMSVLEILEQNTGFTGVYGNNDSSIIKETLKEKEIIKIFDYKIGLFHGHGQEKTTLERAYDKFKEDKVDIIVFGHSHMPLIQTKHKILFINPGSVSNKRKERWYSYIVLNITASKIKVELRLYENKLL